MRSIPPKSSKLPDWFWGQQFPYSVGTSFPLPGGREIWVQRWPITPSQCWL